MSANSLTEASVELILAHLRDKIASALTDVRTLNPDNMVTTIPPRAYLITNVDTGYRTPAVFVLSTSLDFRLDRGPNHISAVENMVVAVEIQDRNERLLTIKGWRYQAALSKLLHNTPLEDVPNNVKIVTKLVRNSFSAVTETGDTQTSSLDKGMFKQETVMELEVEHYENF